MTVIAKLIINDYPVLVADLLISAESKRATEIPTIENMTDVFPDYSGFMPIDLNQKIAIVSDNLMIAWAGSRIGAKTVIREMVEKSKSEPFTRDSFREYLKTIEESVLQDTGFLGFLAYQDRVYPFAFGLRYNALHTEKLGEIGLLGSGSGEATELLKQLIENYSFGTDPENELGEAIANTLLLSGSLLMYEVATAKPLLLYYGGGYEIASCVNKKFQKIGDITYLFWSAQFEGRNIHINQFPYNVFKYFYFDDILVVLSLLLEESPSGAILVKKQVADVIPPVYRNIDKDELKSLSLPSINSRWLCNYFWVKTPEGKFETFARVDHRMEKSLVHFEEEGHKIVGMAVEKSFIENVALEIFNRFTKSNPG